LLEDEKLLREEAQFRIDLCRREKSAQLDLSGLQLKALPEAIQHLNWLTHLNLSGNTIGDRGVALLSGLVNLTHLDLPRNWVGDHGTPHLAGLSRLKHLDLSSDGMVPISHAGMSALSRLTELRSLNLSGNRIRTDGASLLSALINLESLNITGCRIGPLGARFLEQLVELVELRAHGNSFDAEAMKHISLLQNLRRLDVSHNDVGSGGVNHLGRLNQLEELIMAYCGVTDLSALVNLDNLAVLDVSKNAISSRHSALWKKPRLRIVHLQNASLGDTPPEILGRNCLQRLRRHMVAIERDGAVQLRDVKVMILGNGQIGKTQLRRNLTDQPYDDSVPTTHGVQVERTHLKVPSTHSPDSGNDEVPLNIWDFGGQDLYLGTHAMILRTRAVFFLVWTPSSELTPTHTVAGHTSRNYRLEYWLRYIREFAGSRAPIIIVQAQCDHPKSERPPVIEGRVAKSFDAPIRKLAYSAKFRDVERNRSETYGYAAIVKELQASINWLSTKQPISRISEGWYNVKLELERRVDLGSQRVMTIEEFFEICASVGKESDGDGARVLLGLLHELGVVFYMEAYLPGVVILDQQWALDAIYAIFDRESGAYTHFKQERLGRFTRTELGAWLWSRGGSSPDEQNAFLAMARACGICFNLREGSKVDGEAVFLAPDLLPDRSQVEDELADRWEPEVGTDFFEYRFELLPPSLLRNLMARIGDKAGLRGIYWRSGFYFWDMRTNARCRIEEIRPDPYSWPGSIAISIQRGDAAALFDVVRDIVDREVDRLGVKAKELVQQRMETRASSRVSTRAVLQSVGSQRAGQSDDLAGERLLPGYEVNGSECFISYAHPDASDIGQLRAQALERVKVRVRALGFTPAYDAERLAYGESLSKFMRKMAASPRSVVILSDKYIRSPHCMYELLHIFRHCGSDESLFQERVRVVTLEDAKIWTLKDRLAYQKQWVSTRDQSGALVRSVDIPLKDYDDYQHVREFADKTAELLRLVTDTMHVTGIDNIDRLTF
jgi:internalin A